MKSNIVIFWILTAYFFILGTTYTIWNLISNGYVEWAGTTTIFGGAFLSGFIAFYLGLTKRKQGGTIAEDRLDADIDDGDPELGEFAPWSWWPLVLALSASIFVLGLCLGFNYWLTFLSIPLCIVAIVGWVYEYYRGYFAR